MPEYSRTLRFEDLGFSADVACVAGTWKRLGTQKTVEAGMKYAIGRRFDGYACVILKNTSGTVVYAKVRIVVSDPQEFRKIVVLEFNTRITTDMADKTKKKLVPLTMPWVRQDSKIWAEVDIESSDSIDYGLTTSAIDFTAKTVT